LLTHSFAGALPLGIIITSTEKEGAVVLGLRLLLEIVGENGFYGRGHLGPQVIMTDNCSSERNAILEVFPHIVLLLCTFHILQAAWRYIWDNKHKVTNKQHKLHVYSKFKRMVYAQSEENFDKEYNDFREDTICKLYPRIQKYVFKLMKLKHDWAHCFRKELRIRGNNTNNYAEATMCILKDKIFDRKKTFNIVQLVEFIVTRVDKYFERKLIDLAVGKSNSFQLQARYHLRDDINGMKIETIDDGTYKVTNEKKNRILR